MRVHITLQDDVAKDPVRSAAIGMTCMSRIVCGEIGFES